MFLQTIKSLRNKERHTESSLFHSEHIFIINIHTLYLCTKDVLLVLVIRVLLQLLNLQLPLLTLTSRDVRLQLLLIALEEKKELLLSFSDPLDQAAWFPLLFVFHLLQLVVDDAGGKGVEY